MEFEWDEAKRQRNLVKHGVDFLDATVLFDGRPVVTVLGQHPDEPRFLTTGELDGRFS
nr:BrnT family toxin [Chloroflexota bacterium]